MRVRLAEKIMKILGLEAKSANYQTIYDIGDMIIKDMDDYVVVKAAQERDLMDTPKCDKCGKKMEPSFSDNGVLDMWDCPDMDYWSRTHK